MSQPGFFFQILSEDRQQEEPIDTGEAISKFRPYQFHNHIRPNGYEIYSTCLAASPTLHDTD